MERRRLMFWGALLCCSSLLFMQGCATIVSGKTQEVSFTSVPDGATVSVQGRALGKTPVTVQLDKKSEQTIVFEKDGYKTLTLPFTTQLDPWFWGNIVLGGFFGSTTDGISGAVYQYSPSQYNITLQPLEGIKSADRERNDAKTFIIANYKNILPELDSGQGQYVSSLMTLIKVPKEQQSEAIKQITTVPTLVEQIRLVVVWVYLVFAFCARESL